MSRLLAWGAKLLGVAKSVPTMAYVVAALTSSVVALDVWHGRQVDQAYAKGRADVLASARVDTVLSGVVAAHTAALHAKTDTVIRVVTQQSRRVDSIHVADTIRVRFPVVDTLVVESKALVRVVDSLTTAITRERNANALLVATVRASEQQTRLALIRAQDEAKALQSRPTWRATVATSIVSAAIGYGAGRVR